MPIYDATKVVDFSLSTHLSQLDSIPRFTPPRNVTEDIPDDTAVIVGYTIGVYRGNKADSLPYMKWNVQWVIVLGIPERTHATDE